MTRTVTPHIPLESGDRLTRAEFHRRYCARPDIKRAELVEGVVYVSSPTRFEMHGKPHGAMTGLLYVYVARTPGVHLANNATVFLDADNELQPDVCLFRVPAPPGGARATAEDYIEGAPQLVVEIAASSASYDLHDKLRAYRRAGVEEYVVWQVLEREIIWLRLKVGEYVRVQPDAAGVIESSAFPGLRLAVAAMFAGDSQAVLAALD